VESGRVVWRRVILFGVPSLYVVLGLLHPTTNPELGDDTDLFIGLHIAQLFLIAGLAFVLWLLVCRIEDSRFMAKRPAGPEHQAIVMLQQPVFTADSVERQSASHFACQGTP
jgi:hypothetical protein